MGGRQQSTPADTSGLTLSSEVHCIWQTALSRAAPAACTTARSAQAVQQAGEARPGRYVMCTHVPRSSAFQNANCCCTKTRSRLDCSALERVQPRVVSYEEQVTTMREGLADCYQAEDNWAEAAKTLAMIDLDSGEGQPRQGSLKGLGWKVTGQRLATGWPQTP